MKKIDPREFGFERLGKIDIIGKDHLSYVGKEKLKRYRKDIKNGEIFCFAIFKNGERVGTTIAEMTLFDGIKKLVCLETGGGGYDFDKEYLGFYMAIAKVENCQYFVVTTYRPAVMKMAEKAGFKLDYAEYELEVK